MKKKIALVCNTTWGVYNFRLGLIKEFLFKGYDLTVISPKDDYVTKIEGLGCKHIDIKLNRKGTNPFTELKTIYNLYKIVKKEEFYLIIPYTIKPVLYLNLIKYVVNTGYVISVITGLGYAFISNTIISKVAKVLYKIALKKSYKVWFLNNDDKNVFLKSKLVSENKLDVLKGEGVDLQKFALEEYKEGDKEVFLMSSRILWDKGIKEYFEMAAYIKNKYPKAEFQLLGSLDDNPSAVPKKYLQEYIDKGIINHLGFVDDVKDIILNSNCVVLPTFYREGVPRILLEAMAVGRPIITTNSIGSKETVDDHINGLLCNPKSTKDLIDKVEMFIALPFDKKRQMGLKGREKAEREFDEKIIISKYINTIVNLD